MVRILIPTRNRPTSLFAVLKYLARFHPSTEIIVADGSDDVHAASNRRNVDRLKDEISIDYRRYPVELPFFDRILDVLRREPDEFFVMGSDDDFPMVDALDEVRKFLEKNPDYSTGGGALVHLRMLSNTEITARLGLMRPIQGPTSQKRARQYAGWPFSTTYAVTRRELLLERYERAQKLFLIGFYDFTLGVHDSAVGKIKALPTVGFICTRNYKHSYLRPEAGLIFLRRSAQVLTIVDQIRQDLMNYGGLDEPTAQLESEYLIKQRILELAGRPMHKTNKFNEHSMYTNPIVQKQFDIFYSLFEDGNPVREKYADKLKFISLALRANVQSDDNKGEQSFYETLERQMDHKVLALPLEAS